MPVGEILEGVWSHDSLHFDSRFCEAKEFSRRVIHAAFVGYGGYG